MFDVSLNERRLKGSLVRHYLKILNQPRVESTENERRNNHQSSADERQLPAADALVEAG